MVKRTIVYIGAAGIAIAVTLAIVLSPVANIDFYGPPVMLLSVDSVEYEAGIGSFCGHTAPLTTKCVDREIEGSLPDDIVVIPRDSQFQIRMVDYPHPEFLTARLLDSDLNITENELQLVTPTVFLADVPTGDYVLNFFAKWEDAGMSDSSYYYRMSVV